MSEMALVLKGEILKQLNKNEIIGKTPNKVDPYCMRCAHTQIVPSGLL